MNEKGELQYPPETGDLEEDSRKKAKYNASLRHKPGVVNLWDLLSGQYHRDRKEKRKMQKKEKIDQIKRVELLRHQKCLEEQRRLQEMQAECPVDPDVQRITLLNEILNDQKRVLLPRDEIRIRYYITKGVPRDMIEPYDSTMFNRALKTFPPEIKERHRTYIHKTEQEILEDYYISIGRAIVEYVLLDDEEKERLRIETYPVKFPTIVIRPPVPWRNSFIMAKERIRYNFYCSHPVLQALKNLYTTRYASLLVIPHEVLQAQGLPMDPFEFDKFTTALCTKAREIICEKWLVECAELILQLRNTWQNLAPKYQTESSNLIERFFSCINAMLARQIREIIMNSVHHFYDILLKYKDGNSITDGYSDSKFPHCPLLTVTLRPADTKGGNINMYPNTREIRNLLVSIFPKIVRVTKELPTLEQYLFPELQSTSTFLQGVHTYEKELIKIMDSVTEIHFANIPGPDHYLETYNEYSYIFAGKADTDLHKFFQTDPFPILSDFAKKIEMYDSLKDEINNLRRNVPLNLINLNCGELNDFMWKSIDILRTYITDYFADLNRKHNKEIAQTFEMIAARASEMPETTADLVELMHFITDSRDSTMFNMRNMLGTTAEYVLFLMNHAILPAEDISLIAKVFIWPKDMEAVLEMCMSRINLQREIVEAALRNKRNQFEQLMLEHSKALEMYRRKDPPILTMEEMVNNAQGIEVLVNTLNEDKAMADAINTEELLLDFELSPFLLLEQMLTTIEPYDKLWHTVLHFHENYDKWYYGSFMSLHAESVSEEVDLMWRTLYKLSKTFYDVPGSKRVAETVRGKVDKFRQFLPVLQAICTEGLKDRHWKTISEIVGVEVCPDEMSSLSDMIELGLLKHAHKLEEISVNASREFALEKNLLKMKEEWQDITFQFDYFRGSVIPILKAVDDIQVMLDDHILKAQTMRGSPHVKAFETEMQEWEDKLLSMQDILDAWLQVQITWMYLEPIFGSEDIMRQMPEEGRNFRKVDRTWKNIMFYTKENPLVLTATEQPNLLANFKELNGLLEHIQKGLHEYLDKKRLFFPRFFFLSNDELLEILSETKDPTKVQPHLKKCFEGISKLEFSTDRDEKYEITGMISAEGESVPFSSTINPMEAKGLVERWLIQVESMMITSLKDICQDAIKAYRISARTDWVISWPGMIVLCGSSVNWSYEVSHAIEHQKLTNYLEKSTTQVEDMVKIVRGFISPGSRITIEALITLDVHARDTVRSLRDLKVKTITDFHWISQLRYYSHEEIVHVCMITTDLEYGYEYLGNTPRLVMTPLTDRCYRTLMGAFKLNLGGAPEGPAGTGKTETSKDLAKAVAKQCVVFNCSDGLDYKAMGKFFKGLAQSGAWACFDEFNRIDLEVLSVVAQQILTIQLAIIAKKKTFIFEGTELTLNPTCNMFITMNPGYAGRQELPDNLKVLFRTVAMMVPDYGMIGEISLYSKGFENARVLAGKIVDTYKLCSEQLSTQPHYDYGMRAVKTVLIAAGALKQKYPKQDEQIIILRALVDVNMPKFLAQDLPLFTGIYQDLFPGIELPQPDRDDLINSVKGRLVLNNLQPTDWYVMKVIQIYEMILVRHGLMIVGEPMGGKTCGYKNLAEAIGELSVTSKKTKNPEYRVVYIIINPKAITLGQLYGCFDKASHEWSDGVLANTFREFASSSSYERKWIMFDGPVDADWIENMNTVLDDNKKLCLMSGEIIQMTNRMNLIFEPADLEQASPATVSRCGMIYLEPKMLGWRPLMESYFNVLNKKLLQVQLELVQELMEWLVQPCLDFIFNHCKLVVPTSELHLFHSFSRLFTCMIQLDTQNASGISTHSLQCLFLFSLLWGLGSILSSESKKEFDRFYRNLISGATPNHPKPANFKLTKHQLFPEKAPVWEFFYDRKGNGSWVSWLETQERITIPVNAKINEIIVQTDEVARQKFFLKLFLSNDIPILFVGPTGTGKSSIILDYLVTLPKDKYLANMINFSARTSANLTQDVIMSKLDRRRKGVFGPAMGKMCILFVDDMSMPQKEKYGAQPPIELLRQLMDHGHWYDLKNTNRIDIVDILFLGAMVPPGGGSNSVTPRFTRHMNIFSIDAFEDSTLSKIFTSILDWHFAKGFDERITRLSRLIVNATLGVYREAIVNFLPTPANCHYKFNLRDFSKVIKGILLLPSSRASGPEKILRLWVHETFRVFGDRLVCQEDKETLFNMMSKNCYYHIRSHMDMFLADLITDEKALSVNHLGGLFFGNFIDPDADPKIYDEIPSYTQLQSRMVYYLKDYNLQNRLAMHMVMFKYAIEHIARISRILLQDNGHLLLVGTAGTGRSSCVKLATHMAEYQFSQIEITGTYAVQEWKEDVRALLKRAGLEGKQQVFLLTDSQMKDESFVEDINMILNTGDVPNLYTGEEKAEILDKITNIIREANKKFDTSPLALFNYFIDCVKKNLHIALSLLPVGDTFRNRVRMFPSLINCCSIDWFNVWPPEALELVAQSYFHNLDISDVIKGKLVQMCKEFHITTRNTVGKFFETLKRRVYVNPKSYLELLKIFQKILQVKVDEITNLRTRYEVGLEKLDFAAAQVQLMQEALRQLRPELVKTSDDTEKLMVKIEQDTVIVEAKKEIVAADEALANEAAAAAQAIKDDCEGDLAEAIPALEAAIQALNTLKPSDITIIKSMKNPPSGVKLVMEAVCVMKGIKSERKPDPSGTGKMIEDYWGPSLKMLGDLKFLEALKSYDRDNINPAIMKRIRERYIPDRDFDPNVVKLVSNACEGMCKWVRAMEVYDRVNKIVAPKKAKYLEAEEELGIQMGRLNEKRAQLQKVTDNLQALHDEYIAKSKAKKDLEDAIALCTQKLERAEKLIGGLGGEKERWSETATNLRYSLINAIGDVLLSSGVIAYLGPFTIEYRNVLLKGWNQTCFLLGVPCTMPFSMITTLGDQILIRNWKLHGLPVDTFSIENAIIVKNANRWPLLIDPQGQANKWIKNMERANKMIVTKLSDGNYMHYVERAVERGYPILFENILETIDAPLEPILLKNIFKQGAAYHIKVGEHTLHYHKHFRIYFTTRLRNPHFLPGISAKVTIINFMVTPNGLQDQLLGIVVAKERPDLEEKKNKLIVESAENKRNLKDLEDDILKVLSTAEGNILENENAIQTLSQSKFLSEMIQKKQDIAAKTETEIDFARNLYLPVSLHSSTLFFCISELASIEPMYQYSLTWFIQLYYQAIANSECSVDLDERLTNLNNYFTLSVYKNICRSLFEKDKLAFSFILCVGIERSKGKLSEEMLSFFLTGGIGLENPFPNPDPSWLSEKAWSEIIRSTILPELREFRKTIEINNEEWKAFYECFDPIAKIPPSPYQNVDELTWLVILRCLRPDKLVSAVQKYISKKMGKIFIEPPPFNLREAYDDSTCCTPLIFILSPGADPMAGLFKFAEDMGIKRTNILIISLGQGQGPIAAQVINNGINSGNWVVLQNCHLAESWMPQLDKLCDEVIMPQKTNRNFRLWLTSYPCQFFPVMILQNGVKLTNEAPKGLRANLYRSYTSDPISNSKFFTGCRVQETWQRLLFSLCFFHAIVQERRKFGPLGWNIPYEFNDSDLRISVMQLQMFLNEYDEVPFEAIQYLTGECNYGGRVTDDKDRTLLNSLLSTFCNPNILTEPSYSFSKSGLYHIPQDTSHQGILKYIKELPLVPQPEVFGLHANADITKDNQETIALLETVLLTQPQITAVSGIKQSSTLVQNLASDILGKLPPPFDIVQITKKFPTLYEQSMNTVLRQVLCIDYKQSVCCHTNYCTVLQELIRFNGLLKLLVTSLTDVTKAAMGLSVMSLELEEVNSSILIGKVPACWAVKSYPSLKPLASYIADLLLRLKFFQTWINEGIPRVFWISGFFFTQSFLSGILQNYARKNKISIDQLGFQFMVTKFDVDIKYEPDYGVYCKKIMSNEELISFTNQKFAEEEFSAFVNGLFLEGARWNRKTMLLDESLPKILFDTVPIIWFKSGITSKFTNPPSYRCPLYKTTARRGVLSTTGHSTNFIMYIDFATNRPEKHWIDRGVASISQLND
ncbi:dynein heavy chain 3, axonemal isoform X1 [Cimex lectularius]|uniref:AAA+ ATPase domain-containing protein n=1 Tax=Cimex lectularius TaxID=79782 RepID=A0A8I6S110_CIMLE|nr:dynein heavy chain 3, axonemal isoform X1 [Cimex lectularius]